MLLSTAFTSLNPPMLFITGRFWEGGHGILVLFHYATEQIIIKLRGQSKIQLIYTGVLKLAEIKATQFSYLPMLWKPGQLHFCSANGDCNGASSFGAKFHLDCEEKQE